MQNIRMSTVSGDGDEPGGKADRQDLRARLWNFARLRLWLLGDADERWQQELAVLATRQCAAKRQYDEESQRLVRLMAQGMKICDRIQRTWGEINALVPADEQMKARMSRMARRQGQWASETR